MRLPGKPQFDEATHRFLRTPMRELRLYPGEMDDGSTRIFHGFRVRAMTRADRRRAASVFTRRDRRYGARPGRVDDLEDGGVGLPYGGGKGGVICSEAMSLAELERHSAATFAIGRFVGDDRDIPPRRHHAADHGLDDGRIQQDDRLQRSGPITGKPLLLGLQGRGDATARGTVCVRATLTRSDLNEGTTPSRAMATRASWRNCPGDAGLRVVAINDSRGGSTPMASTGRRRWNTKATGGRHGGHPADQHRRFAGAGRRPCPPRWNQLTGENARVR